ncbi:MAG: helix-turn-helix domain-containing protein [Dysgonamonadaceae bacterium]|nr:helix-turn-helix domain-containing protein [Dysgonamonadaceae bacterium]
MADMVYLTSENDIQKIAEIATNNVWKKIVESGVLQVPEKQEKLYTTIEACEILRCSKPTLHRWKKEGIISFVRIGANIRYRESDIKALLEKKGKRR